MMPDFITEHERRLEQLERNLAYRFQNRALLRQAITHKSFTNENPTLGLPHNEALEFLGDSVLNFTISTRLYQMFTSISEGELSRYRSFLVSGQHLAELARSLQLGQFLLLGRGELKTGGAEKPNILIDTLEAIIAAIYLDGKIPRARAFVTRIFRPALSRLKKRELVLEDYKTQLQEHAANMGLKPPRYSIEGEEGPDHQKIFHIRLEIGGKIMGRGLGHSKKEAQQAAARQALQSLEGSEPETGGD